MREPALVFVFEHGPCLDHEPKLGARLRQPVLADVIAQPVRQRADRNHRIDRNDQVEGRVFEVDGAGRPLSGGKADHRRQRKDRQQQANTGAQGHRDIVALNCRELTQF
jgi:hypothetical protein